MGATSIVALLLGLLACIPATHAGSWEPHSSLWLSNPSVSGISAVSADPVTTLVVAGGSGVAWVFLPSTEVTVGYLPIQLPTGGSRFGEGVSIYNAHVAVGAPAHSVGAPSSGAVSVFVPVDVNDYEQGWYQTVLLGNNERYGEFGKRVVLDCADPVVGPCYLAVGAETVYGGGATYVYSPDGGHLNASSWTREATLQEDHSGIKSYGWAIALDASTEILVVGAFIPSKAYAYVRDNTGTWVFADNLGVTGDANVGYSVAIQGTTAFIGARWKDHSSPYQDVGEVVVWEPHDVNNPGGQWKVVQTIDSPTYTNGNSKFAIAMAVYGPYLLVIGYQPTVTYLYENVGGTWEKQDTTLRGGWACTIGKGNVMITADNGGRAALYSSAQYKYAATANAQHHTANHTAPGDNFGVAVASDGAGMAFIGATNEAGTGAVLVYTVDGSNGAYEHVGALAPPTLDAGSQFGTAIAACPGLVVATALGGTGTAYFFASSAAGPDEQYGFVTSVVGTGSSYGYSVAIASDGASAHVAVVGTDSSSGGAAYVYAADGGIPTSSWSLVFTASGGGYWFGRGVAASCSMSLSCFVVVGTPEEHGFTGSARVYAATKADLSVWSLAATLVAGHESGVETVGAGIRVATGYIEASGTSIIVIASEYDSGPSHRSNSGGVHVYRTTGDDPAGPWEYATSMYQPEPVYDGRFGTSIALSADCSMLVIASQKSQAFTYVLANALTGDSRWLLAQQISPCGGTPNVVAITGSIAIIGTGAGTVLFENAGLVQLVPGLVAEGLIDVGCVVDVTVTDLVCPVLMLRHGSYALTNAMLWEVSTPLITELELQTQLRIHGSAVGDLPVLEPYQVDFKEVDAHFSFVKVVGMGPVGAAASTTFDGAAFLLERVADSVAQLSFYHCELTMSPTLVEWGSVARGGFLFVTGGGSVSATSSMVHSCHANFGGAMFIRQGSTATLIDTVVASSSADAGGCMFVTSGGLTMTGGSFQQCTALGGGGLVMQDGATATLAHTAFHNNSATFLEGGGMSVSSATAALENCTFLDNRAEIASGGAVHASMSSQVTIANSRAVGNTAGSGGGGAVSVEVSSLVVIGGEFEDNTATGHGGAITLLAGASGQLQGASLSWNRVTNGNGGALYAATRASLALDNCTLQGNTASGIGGGVAVDSRALATIDAGDVLGCHAATGGGGVGCTGGGQLRVVGGGRIHANTASVRGGGIYSYACTVQLERGFLEDNRVTGVPGAMDDGGGGAALFATTNGPQVDVQAPFTVRRNTGPRPDSTALLLVTDVDCGGTDGAAACAAAPRNPYLRVGASVVGGGTTLWLNRRPDVLPNMTDVFGMPTHMNVTTSTGVEGTGVYTPLPTSVVTGASVAPFTLSLYDDDGQAIAPLSDTVVVAVDTPRLSPDVRPAPALSGTTLAAFSPGGACKVAGLQIAAVPRSVVPLVITLSDTSRGVAALRFDLDVAPCVPGTELQASNTSCAACASGWVSAGGDNAVCTVCPGGTFSDNAGVECMPCGDPALFCPQGSPAPTAVSSGFMSVGGASNTTRTGQQECTEGFYCSGGVPYPCGLASVYCPAAAPSPVPVESGYFSTPEGSVATQRTGQEQCGAGYFCVGGVRSQCPAGRYGDTDGLSSSECSGECDAGYFCAAGSTSSTAAVCGGADVYCPMGTTSRRLASDGVYTVGGAGVTTRSDVSLCLKGHWCSGGVSTPCAAGRYGASDGSGNAECSGACQAGYVCGSGATTAQQEECGLAGGSDLGSKVYCPLGSSSVSFVSDGNYSTGGTVNTRTGEAMCEAGYYCKNGVRSLCPAGRFGNVTGLSEPDCSGDCGAGYYCVSGSVSWNSSACGGVSWYCPAGVGGRLAVSSGYYSTPVGADEEHRTGQQQCEAGRYCSGGVASPCGSVSVYCPAGSKLPLQVQSGFYSTPLSADESQRTGFQQCDIGPW